MTIQYYVLYIKFTKQACYSIYYFFTTNFYFYNQLKFYYYYEKVLFCTLAFLAISGAAKASDLNTSVLQSKEFATAKAELNFTKDYSAANLKVFGCGYTYQIYDGNKKLVASGTYTSLDGADCAVNFALWLFANTPKGGTSTSTAI